LGTLVFLGSFESDHLTILVTHRAGRKRRVPLRSRLPQWGTLRVSLPAAFFVPVTGPYPAGVFTPRQNFGEQRFAALLLLARKKSSEPL